MVSYHELAVRGYVEVLRHYRRIVAIRRALRERLLADKPTLFIGVDAPDFNLNLERDLRANGVKRCILSALRFGLGGLSASREFASLAITCCVFPF